MLIVRVDGMGMAAMCKPKWLCAILSRAVASRVRGQSSQSEKKPNSRQ